MGWADFRLQSVLGKSSLDPGNEIKAKRFIIGMLELAATTFRKMATWWFLVMWSERERSVVQ